MVVLMSRHAPASPGRHARSTNNHAQGTRTSISDVIHCSTGRVTGSCSIGQGAMRDRPNEASTTASPSLIPIRRCSHQDQERPPPVPRPSHINSNRDYTIKQGPSLHQTHWFTQIQLAGGSPTTWSAQTRSPTISHDLPRSPTTWSAQTRSPTIFHDLPRHGRPIDRQLLALSAATISL